MEGADERPIDEYDPQAIEAKWQARWAETGIYRTPTPVEDARTFYCLEFFPYPSGDGLSVGHGRNYVPSDVISRYHRMKGDAVLHPMGWDAFGLPAENEAIRKGFHPRQTTTRYAANYRRQMTLIGCSYDWEREINSSAPEFYRWTQFFFLLLYRRGLAYRAAGRQWWCPACKTVLANEQVESGGVCWRGHAGVYKRDMEQWYLTITAYADELLAYLETLDWPEHVLAMQRNWIGRSEGVEFEMAAGLEQSAEGTAARFTIYTTRPDTVYGMTFAVLSPEHPLVAGSERSTITTPEQRAKVTAYCQAAARRSEVERVQAGRDGVFTGAYAINPVNGARVPVYVADYVLMGYGGGAIMGVPAHDERDFDFAARHAIAAPDARDVLIPLIRVVIAPPGWDGQPLAAAYTGPGTMVNSGPWDGLPSGEAATRITEWMEAQSIGRRTVQVRMRDWLISRQRYWGAPIPIVYCDACGTVPVPERDLPVLLPHVEEWLPGDDGRSPLANVPEFVHTTCPQCGGPARRETDTLDGFACSSWYFLRFVSPHYEQGPFDPQALAQWGPPDLYVGGAEHAVMHLLYARFWTKVMADAGLVPFREPFPVLRSQGVMHARDLDSGQVRRMSKSAGNVVTPDAVAGTYGADALRVYLLFMAPFENNTIWEEEGVVGARRFLQRFWRLANAVASTPSPPRSGGSGDSPPTPAHPASPPRSEGPTVVGAGDRSPTPTHLSRTIHHTVQSVTADVEAFKFNTAIATLMEYLNDLVAYRRTHGVTGELAEAIRIFVLLLAPFAPHVAEELWARLGGPYSVHQQAWPVWEEPGVAEETITLIVQVDGRVRDKLTVPAGIGEAEARQRALECAGVRRQLDGHRVARAIYVPGRLVNVVTESTTT
ncbi:MAG TPA: leucine--tRNA ligase [Anaerolineae bacterium]|nr:leucine--tRNA ligase [Anaerolineae bacterium]